METLCLTEVDKSQAICLYCMAVIMISEQTLVTKNGNYFCCWKCVEEYDKILHAY